MFIAPPAVLLATLHIACGSSVSPVPPGYAGEWVGTTSQGTSIRFHVSDAETVTALTLTYQFSSGCSGTLTYQNLMLQIHTLEPPAPPPYDQPGFGYSTTGQNVNGPTGALIAGYFAPDRRSATGQFTFVNYTGCENVVFGTWTASRR